MEDDEESDEEDLQHQQQQQQLGQIDVQQQQQQQRETEGLQETRQPEQQETQRRPKGRCYWRALPQYQWELRAFGDDPQSPDPPMSDSECSVDISSETDVDEDSSDESDGGGGTSAESSPSAEDSPCSESASVGECEARPAMEEPTGLNQLLEQQLQRDLHQEHLLQLHITHNQPLSFDEDGGIHDGITHQPLLAYGPLQRHEWRVLRMHQANLKSLIMLHQGMLQQGCGSKG